MNSSANPHNPGSQPNRIDGIRQYEQHLYSLASECKCPQAGFFGPGSAFWWVGQEAILVTGAVRALLMQIAHPKIAQAVADHSRFQLNPLERYFHTLHTAEEIIFGDTDTAINAALRVYTLHTTICGRLAEPLPGIHDLTYSATDQDLLFWVYATLIDSLIVTHDTFLPPLSSEKWEVLYQESKQFARLFGIDEEILHATLAGMQSWLCAALHRYPIQVTDTALHLSHSILRSPSRLLLPLNTLLTYGLLPPVLLEAYGFRSRRYVSLAFLALSKTLRYTLPHIPTAWRTLPSYKNARYRCSGENCFAGEFQNRWLTNNRR